jgi:hypothetical protein
MVHGGNIHFIKACGGQMTNMVEPRRAVDTDDTSNDAVQDGELTSLIRRWMAGTRAQDRVRRESVLRIAPEPEDLVPEDLAPEDLAPEAVYVVGTPLAGAGEPDDLVDRAPALDGEPRQHETPGRFPPLPRRTATAETEQVHRVALLIDARRVSSTVATALLARLAERGSVNVCRAYADWSRADLGDWAGQMRREGLHSFHHFTDDDDQALVAITIDAVDIARDAAVDEVVIAGDLTSALPLVHRLHAAGVRVVAVGGAHTPHDVRAACHEFIDSDSLDGDSLVPQGRHRA